MKKPLFEPINKPEILVELVVEQVTTAILNGDLHPGDKLVEERLANQLNVSRIPVREAMQQLEQIGLVTRIPYKGTFVSTLEEQDIRELYELRLPLECLAARLAADKKDAATMGMLARVIEEMEIAAGEKDRRKMIELDAKFHDTLIQISGNRLLVSVWGPVSLKMRRFIMLKRYHTHGTIEAVVPPHKKIADWIRKGEPEKAVAAVEEHLVHVQMRFEETIASEKSLLGADLSGLELD